MWEDGGSKGFEPGTNGGICANCSMKSRWWSGQAGETPKKSRFYFWKRKLLAGSCRIPQSTRPPLTGSKWLPSFQHNFEGMAQKIKCRRKSDTSLFDTKEGEKMGLRLSSLRHNTALAWEREESCRMESRLQGFCSGKGRLCLDGTFSKNLSVTCQSFLN